jgi:hypothetical protein
MSVRGLWAGVGVGLGEVEETVVLLEPLFFEASGTPTRVLFTGTLKVRLTNANGAFIDLNVSGPGTVTLSTGIGVGRGTEVVGVPGHLGFFDGLVVLQFPAESGSISIVSHTGFAKDLCPVLAPG